MALPLRVNMTDSSNREEQPMKIVACPSCGLGSQPGDTCEHCGEELLPPSAEFRPPRMGKLRLRLHERSPELLAAVRDAWREYEKLLPLKGKPSQVEKIAAEAQDVVMFGSEMVADGMPLMVQRAVGRSDLVDVEFEPMGQQEFNAALRRH